MSSLDKNRKKKGNSSTKNEKIRQFTWMVNVQLACYVVGISQPDCVCLRSRTSEKLVLYDNN